MNIRLIPSLFTSLINSLLRRLPTNIFNNSTHQKESSSGRRPRPLPSRRRPRRPPDDEPPFTTIRIRPRKPKPPDPLSFAASLPVDEWDEMEESNSVLQISRSDEDVWDDTAFPFES